MPAPLDQERTWVDPEAQRLAIISNEELEPYLNPELYEGLGGAMAQPDFDPDKPQSVFPPGMYEAVLSLPEEVPAEQTGDENLPKR